MRHLEGPELTSYDVIDADLAKRVRVVSVPVLPRGASGMTIGRWIFLKNDRDRVGDRELMAHELVHVRQYAELGYLRFSVRYLRHYALGFLRHRHHRKAYLSIPAEVEARADASAWRDRHARRDPCADRRRNGQCDPLYRSSPDATNPGPAHRALQRSRGSRPGSPSEPGGQVS